jgi:hypothetical protein
MSHQHGTIGSMISSSEGRIVGLVGPCSAGNCSRLAVHHVEMVTAGRQVAGTVCERCARVTASALFLLDLIA